MKHALWLLLLIAAAASCRKAPAASATTTTTTSVPAAPATASAASGAPGTAAPNSPGRAAAVKPMPVQLPAVLARVNGEEIGRWEFDVAVKRMEQRAGGPLPPEKRDEILRGVLDQLVAYHLLAQESRKRNLDVTDADVDKRMTEIRGGFPTEDAFKQGIAAQGVTVDQLRTQTRTSMQVQKVIDTAVASQVSVADSDVEGFYKQNIDRFKQGESVHASHILIGVPQNATPEQKTQARTKAQTVLTRIRGGADFATVARSESQDPGSAQNGGDLGFFTKGQMTPAFEDAAFKLKTGAVSGVVETPFGFHIIKVSEKKAPHTATLVEAGPQIKNFLLQGQREAKLEQFIEQVKATSKIEILI